MAFCQGDYDAELDEARLIARSEFGHEILLNCTVRIDDVYQRQQDTLIVWTEVDGTDYALSFADIEGCTEVWEFILEVQKHLHNRGVSNGSSLFALHSRWSFLKRANTELGFTTAAQIVQSGHLPMPLTNADLIHEIDKALRAMSRSPKGRDSVVKYLQEAKYVYRLVEAFFLAEKEELLDVLHALCTCVQTIREYSCCITDPLMANLVCLVMLNEPTIYEHILTDELWMGVVGILECTLKPVSFCQLGVLIKNR